MPGGAEGAMTGGVLMRGESKRPKMELILDFCWVGAGGEAVGVSPKISAMRSRLLGPLLPFTDVDGVVSSPKSNYIKVLLISILKYVDEE